MRSDFCLRKTMGCKQRTNEGGGGRDGRNFEKSSRRTTSSVTTYLDPPAFEASKFGPMISP